MKFNTIKTRTNLIVGIGIFIAIAAITTYSSITSYKKDIEHSEKLLATSAQKYASQIKNDLENSIFIARTLAENLGINSETEFKNAFTRKEANRILENTLQKNPALLGTYTLWEPNAFDNKDKDFIDKKGHDKTGRFIPYWVRDGEGNISLIPLEKYEEQGVGDYYLTPKATRELTITSPFIYNVKEKKTLLFSVVYPILNKGNFYGIAGVDFAGSFMQEKAITATKNLYNGYSNIEIFSQHGIYTANTQSPKQVGKKDKVKFEWYQKKLNQVKENIVLFEEDKLLKAIIPVEFTNSSTKWLIQISVPYEIITAPAKKMLWIQLGIGFVVLTLVILVISKLNHRLLEPIKKINSYLKQIAQGNLPKKIDGKYFGELSEMQKSMQDVVNSINTSVNRMNEFIDNAQKGEIEKTQFEITELEGSYSELLDGMNKAAITIATPLIRILEILQALEKGDLSQKLEGDNFAGGWKILQGLLNNVVETNEKVVFFAKAVAEGRLDKIPTVRSEKDELMQAILHMIEVNKDLVEKADKLSNGDLSVEFNTRSENDELLNALSRMVKKLNEVITTISISSLHITDASRQTAQTSQSLSQGASEQAASSEEISASMEEMVSNINHNTDSAQIARQKANESANLAKYVLQASQRSLDSVKEITEKISFINEIADRTDLLAINAAIEAARGGEKGKGFAVVASEIRKLAERSQKAAIEIEEFSKSSIKETEEAGNLINKIVPEINKTADVIEEIVISSREQNNGAEQINTSIIQLSQITQHNSAAAEELSSGAEELQEQVENMNNMVGYFKTKEKINIKISKNQKSKIYPEISDSKGFDINMKDKFDKLDEQFKEYSL